MYKNFIKMLVFTTTSFFAITGLLVAPSQAQELTSFSNGILADGVYEFRNKRTANSVIDMSANGSGAAVHLWEGVMQDQQLWRIQFDSFKNAYKITSLRNLDLELGTNNGADLRVWASSANDPLDRYWQIKFEPGGYVMIENYSYPEMFIDLWNGHQTNNQRNRSRITLASRGNFDDNKRWFPRLITDDNLNNVTRLSIIADRDLHTMWHVGIHTPRLGKLLPNTNVETVYRNSRERFWEPVYDRSRNAYKLVSASSQGQIPLYISTDGNNIFLSPIDNDSAYWRIRSMNSRDDFVLIESLRYNNRVLDLSAGQNGVREGQNIQLYERTADNRFIPNQRWHLLIS